MEALQKLSFSSQEVIHTTIVEFGKEGELPPGMHLETAGEDMLDPAYFLSAGCDETTRLRLLKDQHIAMVEEREQWEEERTSLQRQLMDARTQLKSAEESQRAAWAELRQADAGRARGDSSTDLEESLKNEKRALIEQLKRRDEKMQQLLEQNDDLRIQASDSSKLASRLKVCQEKLEALKGVARKNEELQTQNNELHNELDSVSQQQVEINHLQNRIETLTRERDEALHLPDEYQVQEEVASQPGPQPNNAVCENLTEELRDVSERWRDEKERRMQLESSSADERLAYTSRIMMLEDQLKDQLKENKSKMRESKQILAERDKQLREFKDVLAERDRELYIHRLRGRAESNTLATQEALMSSCFHTLGLHHQKLLMKCKTLSKQHDK